MDTATPYASAANMPSSSRKPLDYPSHPAAPSSDYGNDNDNDNATMTYSKTVQIAARSGRSLRAVASAVFAQAYGVGVTDVIVRATALGWASDEFPGWLEAEVVDANGQAHRIVEKVPVLTTDEFTIATPLPTESWIIADMQHVDVGQVDITFRYSTKTRGGLKSLTLKADDVRWL